MNKHNMTINPQSFNAASKFCNLGVVSYNNKNYQAAIENYLKALDIYPQHGPSLLNLGMLNYELKNFDNAVKYIEFYIRSKNQVSENILLLIITSILKSGSLRFELLFNKDQIGYNQLLKDHVNYALTLYPQNISFLQAKIDYLSNNSRYEEAIEVCKLIAKLTNENLENSPQYLRLLSLSGDEQKVTEIAKKSENELILLLKLEIDSLNGKKEETFNQIKELIKSEKFKTPHSLGLLAKSAFDIKSFEYAEDLILNKLEKSKHESEKVNYYFIMSLLYDKFSQFDKAFESAHSGHSLLTPPDKEEYLRIFKNTKEIFTQNFIEKQKISVKEEYQPIFIVGMPRSGTSLLEQILSVNKKIFPLGESNLIPRIVAKLSPFGKKSNFPFYIKEFYPHTFERIRDDYFHDLQPGIFTDKLPHNFLNVGFIKKIIPNAKIIYIERDPKDIAISIWLRNFSGNHEYSHDFSFLNEYINEFILLMEHWEANVKNDFFHIKYSDLVTNFEKEMLKITDFLNIDHTLNYQEFYKSDRTVKTASKEQVRKPLNNQAIHHWVNYEKFFK